MAIVPACLASLLLGIQAVDSIPPRPIRELVHTRWTRSEGAPTNVRALAQTTDGYLWIGTNAGLVRFDGARFVPFVARGGDSLPPIRIVDDMLATRDGSLWVVWSAGAATRIHGGRAVTYGLSQGLGIARALAESAGGELIAATASGLARFNGDSWQDVTGDWELPGRGTRAVWFAPDGTLWVATDSRVVYRSPGGRGFVEAHELIMASGADFAQARDGSIWMAEMARSVHTVPRAGETQPMTEVHVGSQDILIDRRGALWIGSLGDGLRRVPDPARIRGRKVAQFGTEAEHYTQGDGLLSDVVRALLEDREGNIWVGTTRGLERFKEGAFTPFATPRGIRSRQVFARSDSSVVTSAEQVAGLVQIGRHGVDTIRTGWTTRTMGQDPAGRLWVVTPDGLERQREGDFVAVRPAGANPDLFVDLVVDSGGTAWVFVLGFGLMRLEGNRAVPVAALVDSANVFGLLYADRAGRIWVALQTKAAVYDRGQLRQFPTGRVYRFFEDRSGRIWGATPRGLIYFDDDGFRLLPGLAAAASGAIYGFAEDETGAAWLAADGPVVRLPPGEIDRALADSSHVMRYRRFDHLDGLPGSVIVPALGAVITRARDGRIWVATDSGVGGVDPSSLPRNVVSPVMVEVIRVGGHELDASTGMALAAGSGEIEIDYTTTSLSIPERIRFRYRLEGADRSWNDVGTRRRAYYNGLGPGTYRFRVMADDGYGAWSETESQLSFRILPAWHQTVWFRGLLVLLIGGASAWLAVFIQRQRHRRAQQSLAAQYEATLRERSRIAQDLHDTLLQGFAGVTLQLKAAELSMPDRPDVAAATLATVQRLAHDSLREARARVWDMHEPGLERADLTAALESAARDRAAGTEIGVSVSVTGRKRPLARPLEDAVFRIAREAVANAVRHAAARRIVMVVDFGEELLRVEVRDDGRGFSQAEADEAHRTGHFGLSGMRDRASKAGGRCELRAHPEGGTIVVLELPLEEIHRKAY